MSLEQERAAATAGALAIQTLWLAALQKGVHPRFKDAYIGALTRPGAAAAKQAGTGWNLSVSISSEQSRMALMAEQGYGSVGSSGGQPEIGGTYKYRVNELILKGRNFVNVPFTKTRSAVAEAMAKSLTDPKWQQTYSNAERALLAAKAKTAVAKAEKNPAMSKTPVVNPLTGFTETSELKGSYRIPGGLVPKLMEHHATDILNRMVFAAAAYAKGKKKGANIQGQYRIWRRLTANSKPWLHGAVPAANLVEAIGGSQALKDIAVEAGHNIAIIRRAK